jgi:hypothetical protein
LWRQQAQNGLGEAAGTIQLQASCAALSQKRQVRPGAPSARQPSPSSSSAESSAVSGR